MTNDRQFRTEMNRQKGDWFGTVVVAIGGIIAVGLIGSEVWSLLHHVASTVSGAM